MRCWLELRRQRWLARDRHWALTLQRRAARPGLLVVFMVASRLGDGVVWYATMLALPFIGGPDGLECSGRMLALGGLNLAIYLWLKRRIGRQRPFVSCPDIQACVPALDRFSFPSGHTLHAVAYALLLGHQYPFLASPLWAFALLVASSRVVLGLHYPSDVLAGAIAGGTTAGLAIALAN